MPRLVNAQFDEAFVFTRAIAGPVRGEDGVLDSAAPDVPRFDHDELGGRVGLLVAPGETLGQADRCAVIAGDWEINGAATVLHEYADEEGVIIRRAFYTRSVRATVNAVLRVAGHHRLIGAVPGFLRNEGAEVQYREREWKVDVRIGTGVADEVLGDGSGALAGEDRALVEG